MYVREWKDKVMIVVAGMGPQAITNCIACALAFSSIECNGSDQTGFADRYRVTTPVDGRLLS